MNLMRNKEMLTQNEQQLKIIEQHLKRFAVLAKELRTVTDEDIHIGACFLSQALLIADMDRQITFMAGERDLAAGADNFPW